MSLEEYRVVQAAENILSGLLNDGLASMDIEQRIRETLAQEVNEVWHDCIISRFVAPDGHMQYVAYRSCDKCWHLHMRVVEVLANGEWSWSEPLLYECF